MYAISWTDSEQQLQERQPYELARSRADQLWESGVQDIEVVYIGTGAVVYKFKDGEWLK
ncbi:hypothetical protein [Paenibacillus harenae]|uniref:hypothetical protein n=1 Tax=Paenibacillus harenae TaxID=306543 RepID=UPI0004014A11|nr:hypothetical protein [Paenibacillus harenae]